MKLRWLQTKRRVARLREVFEPGDHRRANRRTKERGRSPRRVAARRTAGAGPARQPQIAAARATGAASPDGVRSRAWGKAGAVRCELGGGGGGADDPLESPTVASPNALRREKRRTPLESARELDEVEAAKSEPHEARRVPRASPAGPARARPPVSGRPRRTARRALRAPRRRRARGRGRARAPAPCGPCRSLRAKVLVGPDGVTADALLREQPLVRSGPPLPEGPPLPPEGERRAPARRARAATR